ncbi:MAG: hypothetical protein ABI625_00610 [bacterium]
MKKPTKARSAVARLTLVAGVLLIGACSRDVTAPSAATPSRAIEASSMFVPSASAKALIGVADGTYSMMIDPTRDQSLYLGPNHLSMPASSICNLVFSGYGAAYWDKGCIPQTTPLLLTVVIKNASSSHPNISFFPSMRFNPAKNVQLYMYAPNVSKYDAKNWSMLYCPDLSNKCVDESEFDSSLVTYIDYTNNILFRRVKHFSGYSVGERGDSTDTGGQ